MGLEEPVGTVIRMTLNEPEEYRVVGVVKDFHLFRFVAAFFQRSSSHRFIRQTVCMSVLCRGRSRRRSGG